MRKTSMYLGVVLFLSLCVGVTSIAISMEWGFMYCSSTAATCTAWAGLPYTTPGGIPCFATGAGSYQNCVGGFSAFCLRNSVGCAGIIGPNVPCPTNLWPPTAGMPSC